MSSNLAKMAQLFKERENKFQIPVCTGTVISASPLKVKFGDSVVLTKDHLVVADHLLGGYKREIEIDTAQLSDLASSGGSITLESSSGSSTDTITNLDIPSATATKITATMTYTDTLVEGDQVILIPDLDYKTWFLVGKVGTVT